MQVCKTFARVAKKNLPNTFIYFVVFMVILIAMSANASATNGKQFQVSSVNLCIFDEDQSTASAALSDYLSSLHHIVSLDSSDRDTLQDNMYYYQIDYVLTIPKGFEQNLTAQSTGNLVETSKRKDSCSGYFVDRQIDNYIQALVLYVKSGVSISDAIASTNTSLAAVPEVETVSFSDTEKSGNDTMYYFFQYFPYVILMMLLEGLSPVLMAFRKPLMKARLSCGALPQSRISAQLRLGMSFLCGIFVPQAYLGEKVLTVGRFLPAYWYVRITNMFASYSDDVYNSQDYWMCIGIQMLFLFDILFSC